MLSRRLPFRFCLFALALAAASLVLPGCDSDGGEEAVEEEPDPQVTVMSYNVYLGFDIFTLLGASNLPEALALGGQSYRTLLRTDYPARAEVLADQIAEAEPALVGLQEAALYRTQDGSDFLDNGAANADEVLFDFVQLLQDALATRGLDYEVAAETRNADVELPVDTDTTEDGTSLRDVRLTDRDVILARADVETSDAEAGLYETRQVYNVGGAVRVELVRGYTKVRATVDGQAFTFFNTHIDGGEPHAGQMEELVEDLLPGYADPLVVVGDFNSAASGEGTNRGYQLLTEDGPFVDANAEANGTDAEFTCCTDEDLRGDSFDDRRIDFVFYRGGAGVEAVSGRVLGDEPADQTPSGLWPSDHAAAVATLSFGD